MRSIMAMLISIPLMCFGQRGQNFIDSLEAIIDIDQNLIKVKDNYYLIQPQTTLPASNVILFAGSNHAVLVDNQWSRVGSNIESVVRSVTDKPIRYIINTHYHFDHTNGNNYFGAKNVAIVAHKNVYNRLATGQYITSGKGKLHQKATPTQGLPSITFQDTLQLIDGRETISIFHFQGAHTDGDAIVHFKKGDIYCTGDIFITYGIPFIDEDTGGDIYETLKAVEYLISVSTPNTRIIPGHGPVCTVDDLLVYKNLLAGYKAQVISLMKKGKSLERIRAEIKIDQNIGGFRDELIPHIYRMALKHEKSLKAIQKAD